MICSEVVCPLCCNNTRTGPICGGTRIVAVTVPLCSNTVRSSIASVAARLSAPVIGAVGPSFGATGGIGVVGSVGSVAACVGGVVGASAEGFSGLSAGSLGAGCMGTSASDC